MNFRRLRVRSVSFRPHKCLDEAIKVARVGIVGSFSGESDNRRLALSGSQSIPCDSGDDWIPGPHLGVTVEETVVVSSMLYGVKSLVFSSLCTKGELTGCPSDIEGQRHTFTSSWPKT